MTFKFCIILILLSFTSFIKGSTVDTTILISDKNPTYLEFDGNLILCDIGVHANETKTPSQDPVNNTVEIKTTNYYVKVGNGYGIVKANKKTPDTKLIIKTTTNFYQITLKYKDITGDIKYYNLKNQDLGEKNSSSPGRSYGENFAEITNLPEDPDIEQKRELLKYNANTVNQKLEYLLISKNEYKEIGIYDNSISAIVNGLSNDNTHFYIKITITNETPVDYRIENSTFQYIKVTKDRILSKRNEERSELNNVIKKETNLVKGNSSKDFVYAIPIFAVDDKSFILISFSEYQGNRTLALEIHAEDIKKSDNI